MTKMIKRLILFLLIIISILICINIYPIIINILNYIFKLFLPFIIGFILAYLLQPIVCFFEKRVHNRFHAVFITLIIFIIILILLFRFSIPYLSKELQELSNNYDSIIEKIEQMINAFASKFSFLPLSYRPTFDNLSDILQSYMDKLTFKPETLISKLFDYISIIVIIPMILVYLLLDYEKIICKIRDYLTNNNKLTLKSCLGELNQFLLIFIKTTFIIMLIMVIICTFSFIFVKLDYPLFFGVIIAITNIIPYLGPYIGGAFPVIYALLDSPEKALIVLVIVIVIQTVESNILSPYLHSKHNELSPLLIIIALVVFGKIFGIIGMIVAVPLLGIIKIALKYYPIRLFTKDKSDKFVEE